MLGVDVALERVFAALAGAEGGDRSVDHSLRHAGVAERLGGLRDDGVPLLGEFTRWVAGRLRCVGKWFWPSYVSLYAFSAFYLLDGESG